MPNVTSLNVNGKKLRVNVDSQTPLLYVLRDHLNLTGTKYGCGEVEMRRVHCARRWVK